MLDIEFGQHKDCDGVSRRDFLRVGGLSALGLTLPGLLKANAQGTPTVGLPSQKRDIAVILLWMGGGPSHIDTFDPKPEATQEIRGSFGAIPTNVSGIQVSEHLPKLAKQMDKFSIIRSVTSPDGTHETATHYLLTGYPFNPAIECPGYGSVIAREKGFQNAMPPYTMFGAMPNMHGGGGYMGAVYNPFVINKAVRSAADSASPMQPNKRRWPSISIKRCDRHVSISAIRSSKRASPELPIQPSS